MRKPFTLLGLVGLSLVAATHAHAAGPAVVAGAAAAAAPPPAGTAVAVPATVPMPAPEPAPAPPAPAPRKLHVGLTLLPMGVGSFTASPGGMTFTTDAAFAYGLGVSAGYMVLPGLVVGIAPQAILNVKPKEEGGDAAKQFDLMARVAYVFPVVDTIALYAEVLPGYSIIVPSYGDWAKGLVVGLGAGAAMDLTDQVFVSLGAGYQIGFQKRSGGGMDADVRTKYLRVALGGGVRF